MPDVTIRRMERGEEHLMLAMWQQEGADFSDNDFRAYRTLDCCHFWAAVDITGEPVGKMSKRFKWVPINFALRFTSLERKYR